MLGVHGYFPVSKVQPQAPLEAWYRTLAEVFSALCVHVYVFFYYIMFPSIEKSTVSSHQKSLPGLKSPLQSTCATPAGTAGLWDEAGSGGAWPWQCSWNLHHHMLRNLRVVSELSELPIVIATMNSHCLPQAYMPGTVLSSEVNTVFTSFTQTRKQLNQDGHPDSGSNTANHSWFCFYLRVNIWERRTCRATSFVLLPFLKCTIV